jgi:hypothetical protein
MPFSSGLRSGFTNNEYRLWAFAPCRFYGYMLCSIVNCTKIFHVKHFDTISPGNAARAFSDAMESENISRFLLIAFSSREPVSTSLENALTERRRAGPFIPPNPENIRAMACRDFLPSFVAPSRIGGNKNPLPNFVAMRSNQTSMWPRRRACGATRWSIHSAAMFWKQLAGPAPAIRPRGEDTK